MSEKKTCPDCGYRWEYYWNPGVTADVIAETGLSGEIILIERRGVPSGWALPGGFIERGESLEETAMREFTEETGMTVRLICQLGTYSNPARDPRKQTVSTVFIGEANGTAKAGDDAKRVGFYNPDHLPADIAFDHREIIEDYIHWKKSVTGNS